MLGDNSADAYVFNGGVPDSSTWRTADGLNFISRMTEGEVSAESIWTQLKQGVPGVSDSPVITDESGYQDLVGEGWFIPVHMRSGFLPMQFLIFISVNR